jgi:hypothetical protein
MENIYNYVFWFNHHTDTWYAIPRDQYIEFFNGSRNYENVLKSSQIETLIAIINSPHLIKDL